MDLAYLIRRAAHQYADVADFEDGTRRSRLGQIVDRAERFANALDSLEMAPLAPIAVLSENRLEYIEVDLGIALARRVRVALNARLNVDEFEYILKDTKAVALIHSGSFRTEAEELRSRAGVHTVDLDDPDGYERLLRDSIATSIIRSGHDEDPAWITYTSGTTGRPKGIRLSHRSLRYVALNILLELGPVVPGSQLVLTQALSHGAGYFVVPQLISGGGVCVMRKYDPETIAALTRRPSVRSLKVVPAMLRDLIAVDKPLDVDSIIYGAAPIHLGLLEESLERFGPVLLQIYGQSEAPVTLTCLGKADHLVRDDRRRSVGRPWRSVCVEVVDPDGRRLDAGEVGEITVFGDHLMSGYLGMPEATAEVLRNGWLLTRDMGFADDNGFIHLVGRRDEMINSGGYKIAPREVEHVLLEHPAVEDCAVFGVPDERWGTAVNAAIHLRAPVSAEAILDFARPKLGIRTPKRIAFVSAIPRTSYGKVDRAGLVDSLLTGPTDGSN